MKPITNFKSMKLSKIKLKLLFLLVLITTFTNAQELTLKQAYDVMLSKNGEAKASNFEVKAMEEEHKATKGLRFPTVGVSGTYLHLDEDIAVDLNSQRNMIGGLLSIPDPAAVLGDWNLTLQEKNLGFATADVAMPIFAGGKINAANKASEIKLDLSEIHHKVKEDELSIFRYRGFGNPGRMYIKTKDGREYDREYNSFWGEESTWRVPFRCKICPDAIGESADVAALADTVAEHLTADAEVYANPEKYFDQVWELIVFYATPWMAIRFFIR